MKLVASCLLAILTGCGGLVAVEREEGGSAGTGDGSGGAASTTTSTTTTSTGSSNADAGAVEYCNTATGPVDAGADLDPGTYPCKPYQDCKYDQANGVWWCSGP